MEARGLKIRPIPGDIYARFCPPTVGEMRAEGICAPFQGKLLPADCTSGCSPVQKARKQQSKGGYMPEWAWWQSQPSQGLQLAKSCWPEINQAVKRYKPPVRKEISHKDVIHSIRSITWFVWGQIHSIWRSSDQFATYANVESLRSTPEINTICTSTIFQSVKRGRKELMAWRHFRVLRRVPPPGHCCVLHLWEMNKMPGRGTVTDHDRLRLIEAHASIGQKGVESLSPPSSPVI